MLKKFFKSIRINILTGLFLTVPMVATILIFNFIFKLTTNWLPKQAFPKLRTLLHGYPLRIITLMVIIAGLYFIGLLIRNFVGRRLYQVGDKILTSIPFIRGIYISVRQISESLFTQRKTLFKKVVVIQYPRKGIYSIAFVTATVPDTIKASMSGTHKKEPCVSLFIPTTPNPTSGILILVPQSEVTPLKIPVTEALTFIMSAGAVIPGGYSASTPTLLDKLELWLRQNDNTPHENTTNVDI